MKRHYVYGRNLSMKSLKFYGLFLLLYFVIPILSGQCVGFSMHEIYLNFNKHILALIGVCFISGAVVAWLPMWMVFSSDDKLLPESCTSARFRCYLLRNLEMAGTA